MKSRKDIYCLSIFSSYSSSWLKHSENYVNNMIERFGLNKKSFVTEVASNDGYLLSILSERVFLSLELNLQRILLRSHDRRVSLLMWTFGKHVACRLAAEGTLADLIIGNNVLAHVPALNDFIAGLKIMLAPDGVITLEFPHLMRLILDVQFDTIYHEHLSYFSLLSLERIFSAHELLIFDVEKLPTHGGSLRIYLRHKGHSTTIITKSIGEIIRQEKKAGLNRIDTYLAFNERVKTIKSELTACLVNLRHAGNVIAAYGAPAKGNTLLNYCRIKRDLIAFTVDKNPCKQGRYLPGSHIPVKSPYVIKQERPGYVLILPWNLKDEIMEQMNFIREWGGKFIIPIPELSVI